MRGFGKEGIIARLSQLDGDLLALYPDHDGFELIVVGGSAIVLRDLAPGKTQTVDIDALQVEREVEGLLARYDINSHVDTFRFKFPSGYEHRLVRVPFEGDMLSVYTLSNEDLVITKMLAWRNQDRDDVAGMLEAGNVDMEKLHAIADDIAELRVNLEDDEWLRFCDHMHEVERLAASRREGQPNDA